MDHIIYVTPAGFVCTCGVAVHTITGAQASHQAYVHSQYRPDHINPLSTAKIIDYRDVTRERDAMGQEVDRLQLVIAQQSTLIARTQEQRTVLNDEINRLLDS